jgi:hypothetical protein
MITYRYLSGVAVAASDELDIARAMGQRVVHHIA